MDTNQLIQFGVLALVVAIIAIAMRREQTVHPPARGQSENRQTDDSRAEPPDASEDTVRTGAREKRRRR